MKEVRFGLIGLGAMGMAHAKTLLGDVPNARLCAAATASQTHAAELLALPGAEDVRVFATPAEMYQSGLIDAVLIATPHRLHVRQAVEAFRAGMHVLLEKPTGVSTQEVRLLNAEADKSGRAFGAMFNQRTNPAYRKMKRLVESGELGEIRRTNVVITDWLRAQSYYDSCAWRATWAEDGGGVLLNQAPHNLDLWQWICGMPVSVTAHCNVGKFHDIEVEDEAVLYTEFAGGATGVFITTTGDLPGTNRLEIVGTLGKIVIEGGTLKHWKLPKSEREICATAPESCPRVESEYTEYTPGNGRAHAGILQNYANALLHGEELIAPGYDGLMQITLINAAYLSAWSGSTKVTLPFDKALYDKLLAEKIAHSSFRSEVKPLAEDKEQSNRWQVNW